MVRSSTPHDAASPTAPGNLVEASSPDVGGAGHEPIPGTGLSLSGGGYRAMVFHLGALWRLNELGLMSRLSRISSVSGGSIVAAYLGLKWSRLAFDDHGVGQAFVPEVVAPIRGLASTTIDVPAVFFGWLGFSTPFWYRSLLFHDATLQDLPDKPRFVINASNVQSGALWRFSKPYVRDYRVGEIRHPVTPLAMAVAASSAFPPILSPVIMRLSPDRFTPDTGDDLQRPPYTSRVVLTDGGVYDNLGLETVWKLYQTVLVSDAGGRPQPQERPAVNWLGHMLRIIPLIHSQIASLRKRQLIDAYRSDAPELHRRGAYWGVGSHMSDYPIADRLPCPEAQTLALAAVPTRLQRMSPILQERLINWGYAICDAALRSHVVPTAPRGAFPYPNAGVGD